MAVMIWVTIFCLVAHDKASAYIDAFWDLYVVANPNMDCPEVTDPQAWSGLYSSNDYVDTSKEVAAASGVAIIFVAFSIYGSIKALADADDAAMRMVKGSS